MSESQTSQSNHSWLEKPVADWFRNFNVEKIIFTLILLLTVVSRFAILDARVMSHDEVNHVRPSWELYQGQGYRHDPVTHGPMQFHLVALAYSLFGDNDFTSRLPQALFSIATVWMVWKFRRYLGKIGAMAAAVMMLISPYMLFYGRYTRNEAFVALFGVLTLYLMLRYLEKPEPKYLLGLAAVFALQFATKETSYIYTAQALLFLLFLFIKRLWDMEWLEPRSRRTFAIGLVVGAICLIAAMAVGIIMSEAVAANSAALSELGGGNVAAASIPEPFNYIILVLAGMGVLALGMAAVFTVMGVGLEKIRTERSFDLIIMIGTLILPQLTAFPVKLLGWDPLDYSTEGMLRTGIILAIITAASILLGLWWKRDVWWKAAVIFYAIYIFFYTTVFTNGQGIFTGIIGSLGYWLNQQGVQRGSQPWYFYGGIQIPIYEFLPAIGAIIATIYAVIRWMNPNNLDVEKRYSIKQDYPDDEAPIGIDDQLPVWLLIYWSIISLVAYSIAGEKMPWLTVHIAWPIILLAGWSFGIILKRIHWKALFTPVGGLSLLTVIIFVVGLIRLVMQLNTQPLPFAGNQLDQLSTTSVFLLTLVFIVGSLMSMFYLKRKNPEIHFGQLTGALVLFVLFILTVRASYRANYINYDSAKEYLVYAHAARGPKDILEQVEEISERVTGGKTLRIGYDNSSLYPYWWYLRDYTNLDYFADQPSKAVRDDAIILVGNPNYAKIEPLVGKGFYSFEYARLWWPNQDYFNLDGARIWEAISNPDIRAGIFDIWLNRDYRKYAEATNNQNLTDETWEPAERIRLYVKKDIAVQIWNYGLSPAPEEVQVDPYESQRIELMPEFAFGSSGDQPGQFSAPRGLAVSPDGTLYVADSRNHRIQRFSAGGDFMQAWGGFGDQTQGSVPGGLFNEPWGVAVGPDGSVFVTDTWNHRIQKFNANGEFISMWGYFGQGENLNALWGPRGIAVDSKGNVFVADTGNKRIVVYASDGTPITSFGEYGLGPGQFDEPVGVAIDQNGYIYVTDTWNQRIQVFTPDITGTEYTLITSWEIAGWYGQSLENKPFITIGKDGSVFVTDPELYRVLQFSATGEFVRTWGDYSTETDGIGLAAGIASDPGGGIYVSDALNNRILHYIIP